MKLEGHWTKRTSLVFPLSSILLESAAALYGKATRMGRGFLGTLTHITHTRRRKRGDFGGCCRNNDYEESKGVLTFELCSLTIEACPLRITSALCRSGTLFRGQAIKTKSGYPRRRRVKI